MKRGIEAIASWLNMQKFLPETEDPITFPVEVTIQHVKKYVKKSAAADMAAHIAHSMYL
jgi:hypothetical protein